MKLYRKRGFYEKFVKRFFDILLVSLALVVFFWLYILVALLVRIKLGSPIIFKQPRPGLVDPKTGEERIFYLYKFRTMTNERDANGNLLSDEKRLTKFGKWLRASSLDELPEAWNILRGDMSLIGPRPQLVRDMVFMTEEQRMRHTAKPGLSGLSQVKGRNAISWEEKLAWDSRYIEKVSFWGDIKIVFETIKVAFFKHDGITDGEHATALDYGDALLESGKISEKEYNDLRSKAESMINRMQ